MKIKLNKKYLLWAIVATCVFVLIVIFAGVFYGGGQSLAEPTSYHLQLDYDEENHVLYGKESVKYVNNYDNAFSELCFHLYPNAFRQNSTSPVVSTNNASSAYPNGLSYGQIDIISVTYENGDIASYKIGGEDENILIVALENELYPDENIELIIEFKTTLANINHRLGYGENTINFGNFYPIACVYERGKGFSQHLYHSNGDPFYSECSNYDVEIAYNDDYEIAFTGEKKGENKQRGKNTVFVKAENVRDFCFVLSDRFEKASQMCGDVEVNYFGYKDDENLQDCLTTCTDALKTFENMFGKYPYPQISIVKSNFVHGGMEYPNIVLISDTINLQSDVNYVIVHEIAHQWWYGLVGNDQYSHAWMDEGLAEFSTLLFFKKNLAYGENFDALVESAVQSYKLFEKVYVKVYGSVDGRMNRPLCEFQTDPEYVQCIYTKGTIMFNSLREMVGDKKLIGTLKNYCEEFKFKIVTPEDLIAKFVSSFGRGIEGFFDSWLEGRVVIQ